MITPSYSMTATERVLPRLALDFTTAALDSRVAVVRAGDTATVINSSGVIVGVNANLPRFDFDPVTLACKGLLIEEPRTNALLNSLIDGTSLATQSVTVTAAARTLSFYGAGQIVLSGAHSATVTGIGAYPTRTTLTFTPTAGTLTLTVTGTVQFAQLESGLFATSFIPTAGAAATRNGDVASMTGTNFSDWFNAPEGTFSIVGAANGRGLGNAAMLGAVTDGTTSNTILIGQMISNNVRTLGVTSGGVNEVLLVSQSTAFPTANINCVGAYKLNNFAGARDGAFLQTDTTGAVPSCNQLTIGSFLGSTGNQYMNGWVRSVRYWPQRLTNAEVQAFSK
jgi:hypothetical protein